MLSTMKKATAPLTCLLIVASLIFVYSVYAAEKKTKIRDATINRQVRVAVAFFIVLNIFFLSL